MTLEETTAKLKYLNDFKMYTINYYVGLSLDQFNRLKPRINEIQILTMHLQNDIILLRERRKELRSLTTRG